MSKELFSATKRKVVALNKTLHLVIFLLIFYP